MSGLLGLFWLVENVCQTALAAVLTVEVVGHEDAGAADLVGALASQTGDLAVLVHLVVLEHSQFDLLLLVLDLLGRGVVLLLALAATAAQTQHQVQRRLLLDVVVGEGTAVLELLAGEDQALLVRWDALLVLDFGLHIFDGITRFDLSSWFQFD